MSAVIRCKMRVQEVVHTLDENAQVSSERVTLSAVYGKEGTPNADWSKWTPSANFTIQINNPSAFNKLKQGRFFFVDFLPASAEE